MWPFLKRLKTVDKQEKSNSSVQLFLEVYYHQRFIIIRNITYENKIITFLKLNEFDQFYKKKLVSYFSEIFELQSVELEKLSAAEESKKPTHTNLHANVMIFSKNDCHFVFWKIHFELRDLWSATGLIFVDQLPYSSSFTKIRPQKKINNFAFKNSNNIFKGLIWKRKN